MGERDQKQKKLERILPPSQNKLYWNTVLNFLPKYSLVQTDRNMEKSSKKAQLVNTRNQKIMCRAALGASGHAGVNSVKCGVHEAVNFCSVCEWAELAS